MTIQEYLQTLSEQIQNRHARQMVCRELQAHMEDQANAYIADGMDGTAAQLEAVRQMGDPVETGIRLNRIHKPKFPAQLLFIALLLTVIGIVMQGMIFSQADNTVISHTYLLRTILYNLTGFAIICGILFFNYTFLIRYSYIFYVIYLILVLSCNYLVRSYGGYWLGSYVLWTLYPILFAAMLYRRKGAGVRGILTCYLLTLIVFMAHALNPRGISLFCSGMLETLLLIVVIVAIAIRKGILAPSSKGMYLAAILPIPALILMEGVLILLQGGGWRLERLTQILYLLSPDPAGTSGAGSAFTNTALQSSAQGFSLWGNRTLPDALPINDLYSTYVLHSIFSWFGIAFGILTVLLLLVFCCGGLILSLRQSNRIGLLLGTTCSLSIMLRLAVNLLINFGFGIYYTNTIPFFTYGLVSGISNSIFVGLILCVYRHKEILSDYCPVTQTRLHLKIERTQKPQQKGMNDYANL